MDTEPTGRRSRLFAILLVACVSVITYMNSLDNSFHYDDEYLVLQNSYIRSLRNLPHFFFTAEPTSFVPVKGYRPITMTSLALNYSLHGLSSVGYNLTDVVLHTLTSILVLLFARTMLKRDSSALIAAVLFAVHPINSQTVNYVWSRGDILTALFLLTSLFLFARARESNQTDAAGAVVQGQSTRLMALSAASFVACLMSKETGIVLPGLLILYEFCFPSGRKVSRTLRNFAKYHWPFLAVALIYLLVVMRHFRMMGGTAPERSTWPTLLTQTRVLVYYIKLLVLPTNLSIDHPFEVSTSMFEPTVLLAIAALLSLVVLAALLSRRYSLAPFCILWFFVTLAPSSGIVPLQTLAAEQRLYLPCIGFSILIGGAAGSLVYRTSGFLEARANRHAWHVAAILALLLLSMATVRRNVDWQTDFSVWSDAVEKYPDSYRARIRLGSIYFKAGQYPSAREHYQKAADIDPRGVEAQYNLGAVFSRLGMYDEAVAHFKETLSVSPEHVAAYNGLGWVYAQQGKADLARHAWQKALELDPSLTDVRENLWLLDSRQ